MSDYIALIELVFIFALVLGFGWWQLRSVERAKRETALKERQPNNE